MRALHRAWTGINWRRLRWWLYALLVSALYLKYFFADVGLQLSAVRSLLILLLVDGAPPPV